MKLFTEVHKRSLKHVLSMYMWHGEDWESWNACRLTTNWEWLNLQPHSNFIPTTLFSGGGGITIPCVWYLPTSFSWRPRKSLKRRSTVISGLLKCFIFVYNDHDTNNENVIRPHADLLAHMSSTLHAKLAQKQPCISSNVYTRRKKISYWHDWQLFYAIKTKRS